MRRKDNCTFTLEAGTKTDSSVFFLVKVMLLLSGKNQGLLKSDSHWGIMHNSLLAFAQCNFWDQLLSFRFDPAFSLILPYFINSNVNCSTTKTLNIRYFHNLWKKSFLAIEYLESLNKINFWFCIIYYFY